MGLRPGGVRHLQLGHRAHAQQSGIRLLLPVGCDVVLANQPDERARIHEELGSAHLRSGSLSSSSSKSPALPISRSWAKASARRRRSATSRSAVFTVSFFVLVPSSLRASASASSSTSTKIFVTAPP